jgi:hypothetical protein
MEDAMSTMIIQESTRFARRTSPAPTPAEVEAMLQAVNVQLIQHDLAPEPTLSPEVCWTIAALAVGGAAGCLGAGLLIGGWLSALAGTRDGRGRRRRFRGDALAGVGRRFVHRQKASYCLPSGRGRPAVRLVGDSPCRDRPARLKQLTHVRDGL